jgi:L-threonylcarbamoyladenylate synthase
VTRSGSMPSHPVALALLDACGVPVAAPSANPSGAVSPTTAGHVQQALGEAVGMILDGGATTVGIESTVVDLSGAEPVVLRPGLITRAELADALGEAVGSADAVEEETEARRSPGMLKRHYAPRGELRLFRTGAAAVQLAGAAQADGATVGALLLHTLNAPVDHPLAMPADPAGYARLLYAALHSLDEQGCDLILVEQVPTRQGWEGIADRLERAAHR